MSNKMRATILALLAVAAAGACRKMLQSMHPANLSSPVLSADGGTPVPRPLAPTPE